MTKINVDTVKLSECGKDILSSVCYFNSNINGLYTKIYNVPRVTKEWVGVAANNYAAMLVKEKDQYINYGISMKKIANILIDYANDINIAIESTKIK